MSLTNRLTITAQEEIFSPVEQAAKLTKEVAGIER
jgi:hypothetical protein